MKIEKVILTHVRIPFREPFRISNGSVSEKDAIIVSLFSEGVVGYGEASPMAGSFYSDDTPESTWDSLVYEIVPSVLKARPESLDDLNALLQKSTAGGFARAGIETATWDAISRSKGKPLSEILGGVRTRIESGLAVGIYDSVDELIKHVERYLRDGYRRLKIKIQKGWDIAPLNSVRSHFGDIPLMVDANCAYDRNDIDYLKQLDEFGLTMIEQPLKKEDLEGLAALQSKITTPVCLDESAANVDTVRRAIGLGSCKIINIKIQRVGGLQQAKAIHDICVGAGISLWVGTMPELGVGAVHALSLATLPGFNYPTDVESSERWFTDEVILPCIRVENGFINVDDYFPYEVNPQVMQKHKVREIAFS